MSMIPALALAFAQVGIGAFGGGLSTLPLIEYHLVTHTGWLTPQQFNQVLAMSQVTPGPIAINAATFVGYQQAGFWGSFFSTLALVAAPLSALCIVLLVLDRAPAEKSKKFKLLLRPLVAGLLTLSLLSPLKATVGSGYYAVALFAVGLVLITRVRFFRENPPALLFIFGIAGIFLLS